MTWTFTILLEFAVWALYRVLRGGKSGKPLSDRDKVLLSRLSGQCVEVQGCCDTLGVAPSYTPLPDIEKGAMEGIRFDPIVDREGLRRAVIAGDDAILTGFLSGRLLSTQQKQVLESGMAVIAKNQEPTNSFLDGWFTAFQAIGGA